jgi:formate hydrogenlyase subunit 6/NADH:ubiquinone oxidoreductase subunit I
MLEITTNMTKGQGTKEDVDLLEEMAETIREFSLCGLGQTAPNTVLSTLRYFRKEYEAHVIEKRCPAGVCKALIQYSILKDKCTGCGACKALCPDQAIQGEPKKTHIIDVAKCVKCNTCRDVCKFEAVAVKHKVD